MRLTIVCNEIPYPVVAGGSADVWRRLEAFRRHGVALHVITWYICRRGRPSPDHVRVLRSVVDEVNLLPVSLGPVGLAKRLLGLRKYPAHVSSRIPSRREWIGLEAAVGAFKPDAVWLDGLYGGAVATRVAAERQLPLFYRSHNVEHRYMSGQAAAAETVSRRLALRAACLRLRGYEEFVVRKSLRHFDISIDDLSFWREQGQRNCLWLPPIVCPPSEYPQAVTRRYDLAFVASLNSPNNTEALRWLTEEVLPEVRRLRGAVSVVVAGSRPTRNVRILCDAVAGLDLVVNPPSTWAVYQLGRVLVNPAQSGSGVQIKTVEMLHTDAPIVCTPVGAQGLPESAKGTLHIVSSPSAFAAAIHAALLAPGVDLVRRAEARGRFSPDAVRTAVLEMESAMQRAGGHGAFR